MPRLQIFELPEAESDRRPPFVLVVDQYEPHRFAVGPNGVDPWLAQWQELADRIGARGVIVTAETVEIPANEIPLGPDGCPVRVRVEPDLTGFEAQVAAAIVKAQEDARRGMPDGRHQFLATDGELLRCSVCGISRTEWASRRDVPTCAEVRATRGGE